MTYSEFKRPDPEDEDLVVKIWEDEGFINNISKKKEAIKGGREYVKYVMTNCNPLNSEQSHQKILSTLMSPFTNIRRLLVWHGIGSGKTCAAVSIAEAFKEQVWRYNTKIHVLVPGPDLIENWYNEIINSCKKGTYNSRKTGISERRRYILEKRRVKKYYKILNFEKFKRSVLGRKDETGFVRESLNSISNLDNSVLIIDEAHNLTTSSDKNKDILDAVLRIVDNSVNLRVLLLTATPMKNKSTDIIGIVNILVDPSKRIRIKDIASGGESTSNTKISRGGIDRMKILLQNRVSFFKGTDERLLPKIVYKGHNLKHVKGSHESTKVVNCTMIKGQIQEKAYSRWILPALNDSLTILPVDKHQLSKAVSNYCFPVLEGNKLICVSDDINIRKFRKQWNSNEDKLRNMVKSRFGIPGVKLTKMHRIPGGGLLNYKYVKKCSAKCYELLRNIYSSCGELCFIYCTRILTGVHVLEELFMENGFAKYGCPGTVNENTVCYHCYKKRDTVDHSKHGGFKPCSFVSFTGSIDDNIKSSVRTTLLDTFNSPGNMDGSVIKIIIGSSVMTEGFSLKNVKQVHIFEGNLNLTNIKQATGRAVRWCSHKNLVRESHLVPIVNVYRYCCVLSGEKKVSADSRVYIHAIKKSNEIGRVGDELSKIAVDCPLNFNANNRVKCGSEKLNSTYWSKDKYIPSKVNLKAFQVNKTSFRVQVVSLIRYYFTIDPVYKTKKLLTLLKRETSMDESDLMEIIEELCPISESDMNLFEDAIYNSNMEKGYLRRLGDYIIFHPWRLNQSSSFLESRLQVFPMSTSSCLSRYMSSDPDLCYSSNCDNKKESKISMDDLRPKNTHREGHKKKVEEGSIVGIFVQRETFGGDVKEAFHIRPKITLGEGSDLKTQSNYTGRYVNSFTLVELSKFAKELNIDPKGMSKREVIVALKQDLMKRDKESTRFAYIIRPKSS